MQKRFDGTVCALHQPSGLFDTEIATVVQRDHFDLVVTELAQVSVDAFRL